MKTIILSDLKLYCKNWRFLLLMIAVLAFGTMAGEMSRFTLSDNLAYNSPYQIAFITAFLSLTSLFFATLFTAQLATKEIDYNFNLIYFSLPISHKQFIASRFTVLFILTFGFTLLLTIGFFTGREMVSYEELSAPFSVSYYFLPMVFFTAANTLFVLAVLTGIAWLTKRKLMVYVSGLLLYVFYMVALLFSGSPFMANQLPQSKQAQWLSAVFDPFGISAFFYQTSKLTIEQRNTDLLHLNGILLSNRVGILVLAFLLLIFTVKKFDPYKKTKAKNADASPKDSIASTPFRFISTRQNKNVKWQSFLSFTKIYGIYVVKSIPFVLLAIGLLFMVGMEIYAEIEKGIRLPQKYATSGLMVSTIIQNFYLLGALIMVFYGNDLYWKSQSSNFHLIEESTVNNRLKFWSIGIVLIGIAFFFTTLMILEGICFQLLYNYPIIETAVYAKTYLFTAFPLVLVAGLSLFIQKLIKQRYASLVAAGVLVLLLTTSMGKLFIKHPLLKFLSSINFDYSDMNRFGPYEPAFAMRLAFGFIIISLLLFLIHQHKKSFSKIGFWVPAILLSCLAFFVGNKVVSGYHPEDSLTEEIRFANYEKQFRKFQDIPQPNISKVVTRIDLFPMQNRYVIKGNYVLENKTHTPINQILFGFSEGFSITKAIIHCKKGKISVSGPYKSVKLPEPLLPNQNLNFEFEMTYGWKAINGHQSLNAIVGNGSFMRISRYFPQIGYQPSYEIESEAIRKQYGLGKATAITPLEAPRVENNDYIALDMTISTDSDQTAIGVGELQKEWKENNRAFFRYSAPAIPFRFAVSSARYSVKKTFYKGKFFEVYYHPSHFENVDYLIKNAKITMDYCETNFGAYPFKTIRFAEVSGFTEGFNATAYPATIFMTEQMAFHCNINADRKQDVINELAGHELAHLWWGNNSQLNPDDREGGIMLSETLAMYTELMLLKKMYGNKKAEESVAMHQGMYESGRGFYGDMPLIKVTGEKIHISYSKGAVAMYRLSELIGEAKVNMALKNFLAKYKYPGMKPIATDFLEEVYKVADKKKHKEIREFFEK